MAKLLRAKTELHTPSDWLLLHTAYLQERLGQTSEAIAAYEQLVAVRTDHHAEALDRVAHLHFLAGNKRRGAERAKQAAQFGVPTVFKAWQSKYYDQRRTTRPPHFELEVLVFRDSPWRPGGRVT